MDPIQFEKQVANLFADKGCTVEHTPKSYDYGVDLIATSSESRIAVQVKMYEKRQVNYQAVMYLFAGKAIYDCDHAVLVTSGGVSPDASKIAQKLGIELVEQWTPISTPTPVNSPTRGQPDTVDTSRDESEFSEIWTAYILPLKGTKVNTLTGKENIITNVTWDYVERISSGGKPSKIDIDIFQLCYAHILENGRMAKREINNLYPKRASAIIFAILAHIPFLDVERHPTTLVLNQAEFNRSG